MQIIWNLTSFDVFSKVNLNYYLYNIYWYMCFRQFVGSFKKIPTFVLFTQEPKPAQNRPALKPC